MVKTPRIYAASGGGFHAMYKLTSGPWIVQYRKYQNGVMSSPRTVHSLGFLGGSNDICEAGNGDIWLTWENWAEDTPEGEQIYAARSTNGGSTWTKFNITQYTYPEGQGAQAKNPLIVPYGPAGSAAVMSNTWRASNYHNQLYSSTFNGSSWTQHSAIGQWTDNSYATEGICRHPGDGSVYWAYGKETVKGNKDWEIYYRRFNGTSWESAVQVSDNTTVDLFFCRPSVAVSESGMLMFVWDDTDKCYARWYTPGVGWSQQVVLGEGPFTRVTWIPGTNDFYAVYSRSDTNQIMGRRFSNGSWQTEQQVSIGIANAYSLDADVCADASGNVYCSWEWHGGSSAPQAWYSILTENDTTAPSTPVVTDSGASTDQADRLWASWTSTDPESGIVEYQYSIGTSAGATNVVGWTTTGLTNSVLRLGLSLAPGTTYYINVKAKNGTGLWSQVGSSDGILCSSVANNIVFNPSEVVSTATDNADTPMLSKSTNGAMHLVYRDNNGGLSRIAYRKYTSTGWTATEFTSSGTPAAWFPDVSEDPAGNIHCIFSNPNGREGNDIYEAIRSGSTWSVPVNLTNNLTMNHYPRLIPGAGSEQAHIISSADKSTYTVKYAVRGASGWTWSTIGSGTFATGRYGPPDFAMDSSNNLLAAWAGNYMTYIRFAKRTGTTWSTPVNVANVSPDNAYDPRIAIGPNGLAHVVFRGGGDPDPTLYYIKQTSATTWSSPAVIGSGIWVTAAVDPYGRIHIAFAKSVASGQRAIFHKYNNGAAWSTEQQLSVNTLLSDPRPSIRIDSQGYVHVAWDDKSTGIQKIYYRNSVPADSTAPAVPVVTDSGAYTTSTSSLSSSWSSSDPETGIAEYQYAIGTTSGGTEVLGWTSAGTNTSVTKTGLALSAGQKYFISVKARNGASIWSGEGSSDGITVVSAVKTSVSSARELADGASVGMSDQTVTAAFNGFFYIEDADRSAGIKVASDASVSVGQKVTFGGVLSTVSGERQITATSVSPGTLGNTVPAPLGMGGKSLGGSSLGQSPGVPGSDGLYNLGLLVRVFGRVSTGGSNFFMIDDGSGAVKVYSSELATPGSYVAVTGVSSVEGTQKVIRVRNLPNQIRNM